MSAKDSCVLAVEPARAEEGEGERLQEAVLEGWLYLKSHTLCMEQQLVFALLGFCLLVLYFLTISPFLPLERE